MPLLTSHNVEGDNGGGHYGPHSRGGGSLVAFSLAAANDTWVGRSHIEAHRSSDSGATWSASATVDFNARVLCFWSVYDADADLVHCAAHVDGGTLYYVAYDPDANTWSTPETVHSRASGNAPGFGVSLAQSPVDGDLWFLYQGDHENVGGSNYRRIVLAHRTAASTFTTYNPGGSGDTIYYTVGEIQFDAAGLLHILYGTWQTRPWYRTFNPTTEAFSTALDLMGSNAPFTVNVARRLTIYDDAGTPRVTCSFRGASSYPTTRSIDGGSLDGGVQVITASAVAVWDSDNSAALYTVVDADQKAVYAVFADAATGDLWLDVNTDGAGWGTDTELVDAVAVRWVDASVYVNGSNEIVIGILYDQTGVGLTFLEHYLRDAPGGGTAHDLAGTVTGASAASGALGRTRPLSTTPAGASAVSGVAVANRGVMGQATGASAITGTLSGAKPLTAAPDGASAITGTLSGAKPLTAAPDGTSAITGTLIASLPLAGGTTGTASVSGALAGAKPLTGQTSGASGITGTLGRSIDLAAGQAASSSVAAVLSVARSLDTAITGTSAVVSALGAARPVAGHSSGQSAVTGALGLDFSLSGLSAGAVEVTAALDRALELTPLGLLADSAITVNLAVAQALVGLVESDSTVAGSLFNAGQVSLEAHAIITSAVAGALGAALALAGSGSSASELQAAVEALRHIVGSVAGTSLVVGAGDRQRGLTGPVIAASSVSGGATRRASLAASPSATSTPSAEITALLALLASLAGTSAVAGALVADVPPSTVKRPGYQSTDDVARALGAAPTVHRQHVHVDREPTERMRRRR